LVFATGQVLVPAAPAAIGSPANAAIAEAIRNDDLAAVDAAMKAGADINGRDAVGATPLVQAAQRDELAVVERLLEAGADPNIVTFDGVSPLQVATQNRATSIALALLDHEAKPNVTGDGGESVLMLAARTGQGDLMKRLIDAGADVNAMESEFHQTALMWSAGHPEQTRLLLEHGADVRARTRVWKVTSRVFVDTYTGHSEPMATDEDYTSDKGGDTPLLFAVRADDAESVKQLLDAGANVNAAAADGTTALILALYKWGWPASDLEHIRAPSFMPNLQLANLLLDRGARVNAENVEGYTPLLCAVLDLVAPKRLSADVHATIREIATDVTPVDVSQGMALVERLLEAGANVQARTRHPTPGPIGAVRISRTPAGSSALHIAALSGNTALVRRLLQHGADTNLVRKDGHSPLTLAIKMNDPDAVQAMIERGADVTRLYSPTEVFSVPNNGKKNAALELGGSFADSRAKQTTLHIAAAAGAFKVVDILAAHGVSTTALNDHGETAYDMAGAQEILRYERAKSANDVLVAIFPNAPGKPAVRDTETSSAIKRIMQAREQLGGTGAR